MADPVIINPTLTLAGQAAAFNAENNGLLLTLTHVTYGTAHYDPDGREVALRAPVGNKVPVAGGSRPTPYQIRMSSVWREDVGEVAIGEIGFWAGDVLVFVWSKADGTVASYKTNGVAYVLFNDLAFGSVPANSISFVIDPNESIALAALSAHEGAYNAHPQYVLRARFPDYQGHLWGDVSGTENAISLKLPAIVELTQYIKGNRFSFKATQTNTGDTTININGVGPVQVLKTGGVPLTVGSIQAGGVYDVYFDGEKFQMTAGAGFASAEATEADVTNLNAADSTSWLSLRRLIKALTSYAKLTGAIFTGPVSGVTPPQFDNDASMATTEFVQRALGNFAKQSTLVAPVAITPAMAGTRIVVTGQGALTLPLWKDSPSGSRYYIVNTGPNTLTVTSRSDELITAFSRSFKTFDIPPGNNAVVTVGDVTYVLEEGTASLKYSDAMAAQTWVTQPQFDSTKALATTEFVKRAGLEFAGFNSVGASTNLGLSSVGGITSAASTTPISLTLPPTSQVTQGATLQVVSAGSGAVTILAPNASSITNSSGIATSVVLRQGDSALFCRVAAEWRLIGGSYFLKNAGVFAASLTGNFYQKLPSGDIEQWGLYVGAPAGSDVTINLPVGMLTAATCVELTFADTQTGQSQGSNPVLQMRGGTESTLVVRNLYGAAASFYWKVRGRA